MTDETKSNEQIYGLLMEVWSSLEDHLLGQEERSHVLKAEIEKLREAQGAMVRTLREIQFAVHRLANPVKGKSWPTHDGDLVGFPGDDF
jgi:hypothetical protein